MPGIVLEKWGRIKGNEQSSLAQGIYQDSRLSLKIEWSRIICSHLVLDFPGGAVVKNLSANAGDTGSSPGPGRSHMPQSN